MPEDMFPIDSVRLARVKRVQTVQHVGIALLLISNAYPHLRSAERDHLLLPIVEMAGAAVMIAAVILENMLHARGKHSRIGWVELGAAGLTLVEAIERLYTPHTMALRIVSFIVPLLLVILAIFDIRPRSLRALSITDGQLIFRDGPFRRHAVSLENARTFRSTRSSLEIEYHDGSRRDLDLAAAKNRDAALIWAASRLRARGLAAE